MTTEPRSTTLAPDRVAALNLDVALSPAELPVVHWLAHGLTNREIAARTHLTEDTVKSHLHRIDVLTGARSRAHLIVWAYEKGYLVPGAPGLWTAGWPQPEPSPESVSVHAWCERLRTARADLDALLTRLGQQ